MTSYNNERYRRLRVEYLGMLGGKCAKCGSTDDLNFDHVDPAEKMFDIAKCLLHRRAKVVEELQKCQVLCGRCHKTKTRENGDHQQGESKHGTHHMYRKFKCRCGLCVAANREYKQEWRAKRRAQGLPAT